jgi:hypothetical protein
VVGNEDARARTHEQEQHYIFLLCSLFPFLSPYSTQSERKGGIETINTRYKLGSARRKENYPERIHICVLDWINRTCEGSYLAEQQENGTNTCQLACACPNVKFDAQKFDLAMWRRVKPCSLSFSRRRQMDSLTLIDAINGVVERWWQQQTLSTRSIKSIGVPCRCDEENWTSAFSLCSSPRDWTDQFRANAYMMREIFEWTSVIYL